MNKKTILKPTPDQYQNQTEKEYQNSKQINQDICVFC